MRFELIPLVAMVAVSLLTSVASATERILTTDHSTYFGEVIEMSDSAVTLEVEWPPVGRVTLEQSTVDPRSWWRLRTERLGNDGVKRLKLAAWAERKGLLVQAVIEFRKARRDPVARDRADESIARVERGLADLLLKRGESFLAAGRPSAARRYFEIICRRYATTDAAQAAAKRLDDVDAAIKRERQRVQTGRERAREQTSPRRDSAEWDAALKAIGTHMKKVEALEADALADARVARYSRRLRLHREHLEKSWDGVNSLGKPPSDAASTAVEQLRSLVKTKLVAAYLRLGEGELALGSVLRAEEWCTKACEFDPEGRDSHALHEKIIDAFLMSGAYASGTPR